jgi:hypothetical protein
MADQSCFRRVGYRRCSSEHHLGYQGDSRKVLLENPAEANIFVPAYMTGCKVAGPLNRLPEIGIARCGAAY